jgi:hypothetical protein
MKGYHKNKRPARYAMKVDLMKAYDSVRWDFIVVALTKIGFPKTIIDWIMVCVTSCHIYFSYVWKSFQGCFAR